MFLKLEIYQKHYKIQADLISLQILYVSEVGFCYKANIL